MGNVKLLDCTLRDGGYVNDWRWGFGAARDIVATQTPPRADNREVGVMSQDECKKPPEKM